MAQQTNQIGDINEMVNMANSPPLKTNNMKLYTEEQVREIMKSTHIHTDNDVDMILPKFTPIELPSDEEIDMKIEDSNYSLECDTGFIIGAKWMRDKILNK